MRVFDFDQAIVRRPGGSVVAGLRSDMSVVPRYDAVCAEHAAYVTALQAEGVAVEVLPPLEAFPDSVFVEDPALVFAEGAILLRPGAPSRLGEIKDMGAVLARRFGGFAALGEGDYADGGDVLVTPSMVFVGLSGRTTRQGAEALARHLAYLGRKPRIVATPEGVLHFKTASSLIAEDTVLVTDAMAKSGIFEGFRRIVVPAGEEAAANALRVNDRIFVGSAFPRTIDLLAKEGYAVKALEVSEIGKLDAGLSCLSLRWSSRL